MFNNVPPISICQRLPNVQAVGKTGKIYMPLMELNKIRDKPPKRGGGTLIMYVGL